VSLSQEHFLQCWMDPKIKIWRIYFWCIQISYIDPWLEECWDMVYVWNHSKSTPIFGFVSLSQEHFPHCWMEPRMKIWRIYFWCIPILDIDPWLDECWDNLYVWNHSKPTQIFGSVSLCARKKGQTGLILGCFCSFGEFSFSNTLSYSRPYIFSSGSSQSWCTNFHDQQLESLTVLIMVA
jgi:hypothetical protein